MRQSNPLMIGRWPIRVNKNSPQARGLKHWWPLQGNKLDYAMSNPLNLSDDTTGPTRTWSTRGAHFDYTSGNHTGSGAAFRCGESRPHSMSIWIRADTNDQSDSKFFSISSASVTIEIDYGGPSPATSIDADFFFGGWQGISVSGSFNDGKWHQAVFRWDGSTAYLTVDGTNTNSTAAYAGINNEDTVDVLIGYSQDGGNRRLKGDASDARLYERFLSDEEVLDLYLNPWDLYYIPVPHHFRAPSTGTTYANSLTYGRSAAIAHNGLFVTNKTISIPKTINQAQAAQWIATTSLTMPNNRQLTPSSQQLLQNVLTLARNLSADLSVGLSLANTIIYPKTQNQSQATELDANNTLQVDAAKDQAQTAQWLATSSLTMPASRQFTPNSQQLFQNALTLALNLNDALSAGLDLANTIIYAKTQNQTQATQLEAHNTLQVDATKDQDQTSELTALANLILVMSKGQTLLTDAQLISNVALSYLLGLTFSRTITAISASLTYARTNSLNLSGLLVTENSVLLAYNIAAAISRAASIDTTLTYAKSLGHTIETTLNAVASLALSEILDIDLQTILQVEATTELAKTLSKATNGTLALDFTLTLAQNLADTLAATLGAVIDVNLALAIVLTLANATHMPTDARTFVIPKDGRTVSVDDNGRIYIIDQNTRTSEV